MRSEQEIRDKMKEFEKLEKDTVTEMNAFKSSDPAILTEVYINLANKYRARKETLQWVLGEIDMK